MCLILFSYKTVPGYRLVLAANRDEFLRRPTAPLAFWSDRPSVLAGRDIEAGGTWLGVNREGRFGALTNFREPRVLFSPSTSRGELLKRYLFGETGIAAFSSYLNREGQHFKGFNLLFGQGDSLFYYSNRAKEVISLEPGIYGLSNHLLDSPWPKVTRGKKLFQSLIEEDTLSREALHGILEDRHRPSDMHLPDTGIGLEWERLLATIFISSDGYGTRSAAVLMIRNEGTLSFSEKSFDHDAGGWQVADERCFYL